MDILQLIIDCWLWFVVNGTNSVIGNIVQNNFILLTIIVTLTATKKDDKILDWLKGLVSKKPEPSKE